MFTREELELNPRLKAAVEKAENPRYNSGLLIIHQVESGKPAPKNKYGAKKTEVNGITFDSKAEARYYEELLRQQAAWLIEDIVCHPKFEITIFDRHICRVELDFRFYDKALSRLRYVDVKGRDNPLSRLKRKLVEAAYGIKVEVVK